MSPPTGFHLPRAWLPKTQLAKLEARKALAGGDRRKVQRGEAMGLPGLVGLGVCLGFALEATVYDND